MSINSRSMRKLIALAAIVITFIAVDVKIWSAVATYHQGQRDFKASVISQAVQLKETGKDANADANTGREKAVRLLVACSINEDSEMMVKLLFRIILVLSVLIVGIAWLLIVRESRDH